MRGGWSTDRLTEHWRLLLLLFWLGAAALMVYERWNGIHWFSLGDTDDNMRMMQVRGLLAGQDWYDLRQYRLDPPHGADIHWSRLVDLPIAGLMWLLRPLIGGQWAEKVAVTVAPLLPMAVAIVAVAVTTRRLISPKAFALGVALLFCAHSARFMWMPLRIDHHGWQLAMLSLVMVGLVDPKRARGGVLVGIASALSLTIGLEMLLYLAAAGAILVLLWIRHDNEARRLASYGASLAGGTALGFGLFASYANRGPVCDALSPVWLSAMVLAGALSVLLALVNPTSPLRRILAAGAGGVLLTAALVYFWPHCIGRLEGVSPEAEAMWLNNVREALPIYRQSASVMAAVLPLPLVGLAGYATMIWRLRGNEAARRPWMALGLLAFAATSLLIWQSRAGPAAQILGVPGAAALAWLVIPRLQASRQMMVRVFGTVTAFLIISGIGPQSAIKLLPAVENRNLRMQSVNRANGQCPTLPALKPIAQQPKGYVLTFVDLAPRLITVTHHDSVAGPYHRNDDDIVAVMKAFRGTPENALRMVTERNIDYVLICPWLSESTVYRATSPKGFYVQLAEGKAPGWLEPIALPKGSPYKMWRVVRR
jgi:hypothetical protein